MLGHWEWLYGLHTHTRRRYKALLLLHTVHVRAQSTIVSRIRTCVCTFCVPTSQGNTTDQEKPCANAGLGLEVWTVVGAACLPCQDNSGCESVPDEIAGESERAGEGVKSEQTEQC
ncbi:AGAP013522-PA [Anopheles gambiae str. PEST]|uniref:AGAP013522-PA n=1 Tax=Anopheles gambiae TaxID=7165 RepID=F5HLZ3_ANOGA|nr:AGAP013522-PA [Anopheles gambiae str. PEST]